MVVTLWHALAQKEEKTTDTFKGAIVLPSVRGAYRLERRGRTTGSGTSNLRGCKYLMKGHQPSDDHASCGGGILHEPLPMNPLMAKGIGEGGVWGGVARVRYEK